MTATDAIVFIGLIVAFQTFVTGITCGWKVAAWSFICIGIPGLIFIALAGWAFN